MEKCNWCEDSGVVFSADGFDDFNTDYCSCTAGSFKMQNDELRADIKNLANKMRYA